VTAYTSAVAALVTTRLIFSHYSSLVTKAATSPSALQPAQGEPTRRNHRRPFTLFPELPAHPPDL